MELRIAGIGPLVNLVPGAAFGGLAAGLRASGIAGSAFLRSRLARGCVRASRTQRLSALLIPSASK